MPRMGRMGLPAYPHHVAQRGHSRQIVLAARADINACLKTLSGFEGVFSVKSYAYCLVTSHVHLLVAPDLECRTRLGSVSSVSI